MQASPEGRVKASPFFSRRLPRPLAWLHQVSEGSLDICTFVVGVGALTSLSDASTTLVCLPVSIAGFTAISTEHFSALVVACIDIASCELKGTTLASALACCVGTSFKRPSVVEAMASFSAAEDSFGEETGLGSNCIDERVELSEDGSDDTSSITVFLN